jgi:hypothetical protein
LIYQSAFLNLRPDILLIYCQEFSLLITSIRQMVDSDYARSPFSTYRTSITEVPIGKLARQHGIEISPGQLAGWKSDPDDDGRLLRKYTKSGLKCFWGILNNKTVFKAKLHFERDPAVISQLFRFE